MIRLMLMMLALVTSSLPSLADDVFAVLPEGQTAMALKQCSRGSPPIGEATWRPSEADILRLEAGLPASMKAAGHPDVAEALTSQPRQYVGIVRGGRKFVYASFLPSSARDMDWRNVALVVCDGGARLFGVEMDAETGAVTHYAANGF